MARKTTSVHCLGEGVIERCARTPDNATKQVLGKKACMACIEARLQDTDRKAKHDSLTGLPNNRGLEERFDKLRKSGGPIGMIFIDLTNFKNVNETNGHTGGDIALRYTAKQLQKVVRHDDPNGHDDMLVSRKGGDEMLILVDLTPRFEETVKTTSEQDRLERAASHISGYYAGRPEVFRYNLDVTPSKKLGLRMGLALYEEGMSLEDLVTAADPKGKQEDEPATLMPGIQLMLQNLEQDL